MKVASLFNLLSNLRIMNNIIIIMVTVVTLMTTSLGSDDFHKEEANGHVSTGGQRDGISCQ